MKKIKKMISFLFLCSLLFLFVFACGKKEDKNEQKIYAYYVNQEHVGLEKREITLEKLDTEGQIEEILAALINCEEKELESVYPKNVRIEKWENKDSDLTLFFGKSYKKMSVEEELLLRTATVKALCQLDGVDFVEFFVNGKKLKNADHHVIGYMNEDFFVGNTGSSLHSFKEKAVRLYFADEKGMVLVEKKMNLRYNSNSSLEKVIVNQLLKGPADVALSPVIPPETKILGVSVQDGICYVNFDENILNRSLHVNPKITIYAIVNSVIENTDVSKVQIIVNGESGIVFQDTVDLKEPLSMNLELLEGGD